MTFISTIKEPKKKEPIHDKVSFVAWNRGVNEKGKAIHLVRFENGWGKEMTTEEVKKVFPEHFERKKSHVKRLLQ
jgi:hypothetical protein